jgi:signal transduction histidine kinase
MRILFVPFLLVLSAVAQAQSGLMQTFVKIDSVYMTVREDNLKEAFKLSLQEDSVAQLINSDSLILLSKFHKSQTLVLLGFYDIALKELYDGLKKADEAKNTYFQYRFNYSIGQAYAAIEDHKNTMKFYLLAKQKAIENGSLKDTLFINYDIGNCTYYMGDAKKSEEIITRNLATALATNDSTSIFFGLDNMAFVHVMNGEAQKGVDVLKRVFQYPKTFENNNRKNILYSHLAELSKEAGNATATQQYCDSLFKYARLMKSDDWLKIAYRMQSKIDEAKGNYKSALSNLNIFMQKKDSSFKENYDSKMAVMANLYELDKKQIEIKNLSKDKELARAKIQRLSLGIVALVLGSLIVGMYFFYRKRQQEILQKELFAQQLLNAQEQERQRIAKDLHDSVGQNILFIKNQLQSKDRNEQLLATSIDTALEEVRNISKDLYPNQLEKYGLKSAVDALGEQVQAASGIFVSSDLEGIDVALNKNVQINFYRIIQEFVNNTIKHAQATAIRITAEQTLNEIRLIVQDNGKGFDKALLEQKAHTSFGLLNMEERIKMLKGKVSIESEPGKGTKSIFTIPV